MIIFCEAYVVRPSRSKHCRVLGTGSWYIITMSFLEYYDWTLQFQVTFYTNTLRQLQYSEKLL
jgi:hypothetical protein